jgi:hypothetical protein
LLAINRTFPYGYLVSTLEQSIGGTRNVSISV